MTKSIQVWLFRLPLMQGIEDLCNGFRMLEFLSQITKEIQARVLSAEEEPELSDEDLIGSTSAKVNDPVRMYLKEIRGCSSLD